MKRFAGLIVAGLLMAGPAVAQDADWNAVIAAAKKEGKVTVYNSAIGAGYYATVAKAFEKKYGITVETLDVRASELTERIRSEQAAGRFIGDLEAHGQATATRQEAAGMLQGHGGLPNLKNLRPEFKAEGSRVPAYVQAYAILYNTNMVKGADVPKSWKDLLDPKWKGKILADDVRAIGGGQIMFFATYDAIGQEFHEKLAQQQLVFSRDIVNDTKRTARGEYPLYIPLRVADFLDIKSLPVKVALPVEGMPYVRIDMAMLKNAPHPNAAKVFMNHFLEVDSQLEYANNGQLPVVTGVVEKVGPDMKDIAAAKLMGTSTPERQDEMLQRAKAIYK